MKSPIRKPLIKSDAGFKPVLLQKGKTDFSWNSESWIQINALRRGTAKFYCFKLQFEFLPVRLWRIFSKLVHVAAALTIRFSVHSPAQFGSNTVPYTGEICADSYPSYIYWPFLSLEMPTIFFFNNLIMKISLFPDVTFHNFRRNSYLKNLPQFHHRTYLSMFL